MLGIRPFYSLTPYPITRFSSTHTNEWDIDLSDSNAVEAKAKEIKDRIGGGFPLNNDKTQWKPEEIKAYEEITRLTAANLNVQTHAKLSKLNKK